MSAIVLAALALIAQAPEVPAAPEGFTTFEFEGAPDQAATLNGFTWYHFHTRGGNGPVLFNKEYLTTADLWLNEARPRETEQLIQAVHRGNLLEMQLDPEGYVHTHQHFSHAHDEGWPFPLWTQSGAGSAGVLGQTAGWHFQPVEAVPGWVKGYLEGWNDPRWYGDGAVTSWTVEGATSSGIVNNRWHIEPAGAQAILISPDGVNIDAFQAPFLQLRWQRSGTPQTQAPPYIEWLREGDAEYSAERRMHFYPEKMALSTEFFHSIMPMHRHPLWQGKITRMRLVLAPGEADVSFDIDSFFTVYDTRHTINNPIYILASWNYFRWTGDIAFLRSQINRMRTALRYQQTELGGLEHNFIRVTWPGHDGIPGYTTGPNGEKTIRGGHGIGNNYWDIMPYGGDDMYATSQYYAATLAMAEAEEAIEKHPGWSMSLGTLRLDPRELREHAEAVKRRANQKFWNETTGRFVGSIDVEGRAYDYGHSFLNLDAIWYGIATDEHAQSILSWLTGERVVEGDTSQGPDIYHWRFGPRATTLRNVEWYGQGWTAPESLAFGDQVQDGGAVLGFTFYDLWARLKYLGADNAWQRLSEILAWEAEVKAEGGYRAYYAPEKARGSLQGGGTPGGLGIDHEFYESSLLPAIVPFGFLGLSPGADTLHLAPKVPAAIPSITARNVRYRGVTLNVTAKAGEILVEVKQAPVLPFKMSAGTEWSLEGGATGAPVTVSASGIYRWFR